MTKQARADLFLFSTTFIWGSTFVIFKVMLNYISPILFLVLRYGFAAILFYLLFAKKLKSINIQTVKKGIILGLILGIGLMIQTIGVVYTTASKSAFITGMMVIFTPLAQIFILKKNPTFSNFIGIGLVILGFYFLTYPIETNTNFGDLLVLFSSILFGVYIVYLDLFSKNEDSTQLSFLQVITVSILCLLFLPFENINFKLNFQLVWMLSYMIILATVFATYIQTHFQKDTTPTKAVLIFSIEPVIASVLANYFINENIGFIGVIGGGLIILGILVSEFLESILKFLKFTKVNEY